MINFQVLLFFLLSSILLHVQSSPLNTSSNSTVLSDNLLFNITIGSSIIASTNETSYWLSPSGVFAFGFYPLCDDNCDRYEVGIWINKPSKKILVWTASIEDNIPISNVSSILLYRDGVFMLRTEGIIVTSVFGVMSEVASYALMQNTGNFVIYNRNSSIIWQSFDHPSHTILQGQTLKSGSKLVQNNGYELVMEDNGNLSLLLCDDPAFDCGYRWDSGTQKENSKFELHLDMTGQLYLVDSLDGLVIKNLSKGDEHAHKDGMTVYRAKLGLDGVFRLYAERMIEDGQSVVLWQSNDKPLLQKIPVVLWIFGILLIILLIAVFVELVKLGIKSCMNIVAE